MVSAQTLVGKEAKRMKTAGDGFGISPAALAAYSVPDALTAAIEGHNRSSGLEVELSQEISRQISEVAAVPSTHPHSIVLPGSAFFASLGPDNDGAGQELVPPASLGGLPVRAPLRNIPRLFLLGARGHSGPTALRLVRTTEGWRFAWVDRNSLEDDVDLTDFSFDSEAIDIRMGMAGCAFSRTLARQGNVLGLLRDDVDRAVANLVDYAGIAGRGESEQEPPGLFSRDMPLGPSLGADGGSLDWEALVAIEERADEDGNRQGWLTTPGVRRVLRQLPEVGAGAGPAWRGGPAPGFVLGAPAFASGHVPTDLEKGGGQDLHGLIYSSDWSQLVIQLLAVQVLVDPYTLGGRGISLARVYVWVGVGLHHPQPFVRVGDIAVPGALS